MTTFRPADRRGAAGWLSLAASPTFALMAWLAVKAPYSVCASGSGFLPVDGMTAMYILMSLFHLPPWLRVSHSAHATDR